MLPLNRSLAVFQIGWHPDTELSQLFSELIMSVRQRCWRILTASPVGNCPYLTRAPSAPTRSRNLEIWGIENRGIENRGIENRRIEDRGIEIWDIEIWGIAQWGITQSQVK